MKRFIFFVSVFIFLFRIPFTELVQRRRTIFLKRKQKHCIVSYYKREPSKGMFWVSTVLRNNSHLLNRSNLKTGTHLGERHFSKRLDSVAVKMNGVDTIWRMPSKEGKKLTGLVVNNSMSHSKVEFVPQEGNIIRWYACGPTVYDASHMGHARTYVSFDIIRRILTNYFNYDVHLVINITDIDDKIIKRSEEEKVEFSELAKKWELDFWEDMKNLNVLLPTSITRVSEYVDDIIKYIEKIIENKYAYVCEGSVYFDIEAFKNSKKHVYAKMEPSSVQDEGRILEGEGNLGVVAKTKKNSFDFALWKASKPNEPSWKSPWGNGRPGWHIECSTMASNILGKVLDIHSGGIDLRFPHHDNEVAQSEAFFDHGQWVNYFLHSGHLHIEGLKMSKSLKNFITIKNMLSKYTSNQIRILFLLNKWDSFMNYKPEGESMVQCIEIEKSFVNFFALVDMKIKTFDFRSSNLFWSSEDQKMNDTFRETKNKVHEFLLDNFNTPEALVAIQKLITEIHNYLKRESTQIGLLIEMKQYITFMLTTFGLTYEDAKKADAEKYDKVLHVLGNYRKNIRGILQKNAKLVKGVLKETKEKHEQNEKKETTEEESLKRNKTYVDFVENVKVNNEELLKECDLLRDEHLLNLGVLIDDRSNNEFVIKLLNENELEQEKKKREQEMLKRGNSPKLTNNNSNNNMGIKK